ncbi:ribonuclease J [Breoghania sp.]|uniref:ribonuclease J n=1 Tax=Breoghania sp. TaxID=2065378 RepID=UPI002AA5F0ED|nr:ribonuclease J [Breoghania sp.]
MTDNAELVFCPLGGVGEIGMNMGLYGFGPANERTWLMVDCGVSFAGPDLPGVDLIMPDIRFIEAERKNLAGIIITHAHEDHYGALMDLWPRLEVPVYCTPFTAGLLKAKVYGHGGVDVPVTVVEQGERIQVGPFDVELVAMSHSIPEPTALAIRTEFGTVLHSGDWKIDPEPGVGKPIDVKRLREIGDEGVLALISDSTNATREGVSPSEADVARSLTEIISKAKHRVAVTTFASNVARLRGVALAAEACDRDVVVIGRAMKRTLDVAAELGYMDGIKPFLDEEAYGYLPRDKVLALCTGSQGEARAALARIASDDHRSITLNSGDMVIFSSRTIPGNEREVNRIINALVSDGINVMTDRDGLVHVSGHPRLGEMEQLYDMIRPKIALPVHGEAMHLEAHARFARKQGVKTVITAYNGTMVRLAPGKAEAIDEVPVGQILKDGGMLVEPEFSGVVERRRLSFGGVVVGSIVLNSAGEIVADTDVVVIGVPEVDEDGDDFEEIVIDAIEGAIESIPRKRRRDPELVREAARRAARSAVVQRWGKKPVCKILVSVV